MSGITYRIKLYGFTGDDRAMFCRDLAAVLDISVDRAGILLMGVPVVLAEGLDKRTATRLAELIQSKQGLCLVEPEQDEPDEEAAGPERGMPATDQSPEDARGEKPTPLASRLVLGALATLASVLIIYIAVGLVSSVLKVRRENPTPATSVPPPVDLDETTSERPAPPPAGPSAEEVQNRAQELQARLDELRVRLAVVENYLRSHRRPGSGDRAEFERQAEEAKELRREIFLATRDLETIKSRTEGTASIPEE